MTSIPECFSESYADARPKFCAAAAQAGGALRSWLNPKARGPGGESLYLDTARFGPADAANMLVLIAGTHGVEGHCGSGAEIAWLQTGGAGQLPKDTGALVIHALNPYGFAWSRRVTEDNVDLNRNWVPFNGAVPENPAYDALADAIVPSDWSEETQTAARARLLAYAREHGFPALQQAVSGGQYRHAAGVFYGGTAPTWSRRTQTSIYETFLSGAGRVGIIDFHTGLGPYGYAERIMTARRGDAEYDRANLWYGQALTSPADGDSTSSDVSGDGLLVAPGLLPHAQVTGVALEYGTVDTVVVLDALRADAWLHAHGDPTGPEAKPIKDKLRACFYPDTDVWKGMVAGQALLSIRQALAGLQR